MIDEALLEEKEPIPDKLTLHKLRRDDVTEKDLVAIVQDSFGEIVSDDYIPYLIQNNAKVYFRYDRKQGEVVLIGTAVVIEEPAKGVPPHLVTLAVAPAYQDKGIGKEIMAELLRYYPKLNWRSKPERVVAYNLYNTITKDIVFFTAIDGMSYRGYFVNHTLEEKQKALIYMTQQQSHFKK